MNQGIKDLTDLTDLHKQGKINRRQFLRYASLLGLTLTGAEALLAGCAPAPTSSTPEQAPTTAPAAPAAAAGATAAPAAAASTTEAAKAAGAIKRGGSLKHGLAAPTTLDPALMSGIADIEIVHQYHDFFVFLDEDNKPDPARSLAESWESSSDGMVWTFKLRKGIKFHSGKDLTAKDVVFTFKRLSDKDQGAATAELYSSIKSIEAPDDFTVKFTLGDTNPDFLTNLGDFHAVVVDSDAKDFKTDKNGTGPWIVESYVPEDRIKFKKNPDYWMKGADGQPLPYMDGMEWLFIADSAAQLEALRGGQIDFINYVSPEQAEALKGDANVAMVEKTSNEHWVIHMRSDKGPAADVKVRQAMKAATDRKAMLDTVLLGHGITGRDTPIGPWFGDYYLDTPEMKVDIDKAKKLLAEAGHPDGIKIDLTVQNFLVGPSMATVWKEQLAKAGIEVNLQLTPSDAYYADDVWLQCDFGTTDWGARPTPQAYLALAYTSDAKWNESHFSDPELDKLAAAAAKEMDHAKRVEEYHQIQQIFQDRGSVIMPFFLNNITAMRKAVKDFKPHGMQVHIDLRRVWLDA